MRRETRRRNASFARASADRRRDFGPRLLSVGAAVSTWRATRRRSSPGWSGRRDSIRETTGLISTWATTAGASARTDGQWSIIKRPLHCGPILRGPDAIARCFITHAGEWDLALDDLNRALASPEGADLLEARLVLGLVKQVLGDDAGARAAYDAVIAAGPGNPFASAARLNRAKLDIDSGDVDRAWAEYDALLAADPARRPGAV